MEARHLAIAACLATWGTMVASTLTGLEDPNGGYTVCRTEICRQRAQLINASLDRCIDPCDDFYAYACGGWIKSHEIPESKSWTGNLGILRDELQKTLKDILENMSLVYECQNITDKAAVAYNACMAVPAMEDQRDAMGEIMAAPGVAHWPITNDTGDMFKNCSEVLNQTGLFPVFTSAVRRDITTLNSYAIWLDQLSFKTVGRNQLIQPEKKTNVKIIDAYKNLTKAALRFMRPNISDEELTTLSEELVNFEGQLANLTASREERRDVMKRYLRTTIGELQKNFTSVPLLSLLNKEFSKANITLYENETVEWYGSKYYSKLNSFLECADPNTLYNYAGFKIMLQYGAQVSEDFRNASFELTKASTGVVTDKPSSLNYGAIGMVIGHEMTHGFDDSGSQFDAEGALRQWWTNKTRARFEKKAVCFIEQYGNITDKVANMSLNGKNTVGENIADNGGLRMVFEALDKALKEDCENDTRLVGLEEFSTKKLFFLANAMIWCSKSRPEFIRRQIQYDPHSPYQYRVKVPMSNMPAFSTVFNCSSNSTMNTEHRCTLW